MSEPAFGAPESDGDGGPAPDTDESAGALRAAPSPPDRHREVLGSEAPAIDNNAPAGWR